MSKRLHHYLMQRKLNLLNLNTFLCNWILDFLLGNATSGNIALTTGIPPLPFMLQIYISAVKHVSEYIMSNYVKSAYRHEAVKQLINCYNK